MPVVAGAGRTVALSSGGKAACRTVELVPRGVREARQLSLTQAEEHNADSAASQLAAAKAVVWRGRGELPQFPWNNVRIPSGLFVLLDLWGGLSGACIALLILGVRFIAVSAEQDGDLCESVRACLPNVVHVPKVEQITGELFKPLLKRRGDKIVGFIIGGGAPCQGNSSQNQQRRGWGDLRSRQPLELSRILEELQPLSVEYSIAVLRYLENVASMPKDVEAIYSKIMGCSPVLFDASRTGWVARLRFLWGAGPRGGITDLPHPRPPLDWEFQDRITVSKVRVKELAYVGDKSLPEQVHFEEGYAPTFKAKDIVAAQGQGAMYTFARQFEHPPDRLSQASEEAGERFFEDGCAFSPPASEEHNLLWKGDSWRMPNPRERARIHMLPEALVEAYPRKLGETTLQRHANQNSAMGNGFHIPSVCAFFVMLFQTMQAEHIYAPMQCRQETWLSNRVEGTAFQPGIARDFPGVARDTELLLDMQMQFQSLQMPKV
jgi:hypothetical protein